MNLKALKNAGIGFEAGTEDFKENRPTLLMIHGAGGGAQNWRNQVYPLKSKLNTLPLICRAMENPPEIRKTPSTGMPNG